MDERSCRAMLFFCEDEVGDGQCQDQGGALRNSANRLPATEPGETPSGDCNKCRAAVCRVGMDWEIREVDLDPPHAGEVLVRMALPDLTPMTTLLPARIADPRCASTVFRTGPVPDARCHEALVSSRNRAGRDDGAAGDHYDVLLGAAGAVLCKVRATSATRRKFFSREMLPRTCRRHLATKTDGLRSTRTSPRSVLTDRSSSRIDDTIPFMLLTGRARQTPAGSQRFRAEPVTPSSSSYRCVG